MYSDDQELDTIVKTNLAKRRNVSIRDTDYAALQALGGGNASEGIREALRQCRARDTVNSGSVKTDNQKRQA